MEDYYVVPWVRIQPYLMGMILGFILFKLRKTEKLKIHSIAVTWCWVRAIITSFTSNRVKLRLGFT